MTIAFDASATGESNPGTGLSFSHTCTGTNLILYLFAVANGGDHITGATYAGTAMTLVDKQATTTSGYTYSFILINPSTGANTLALTTDSTSIYYGALTSSYTGAKQSAQPDAHNVFSAASGATYSESLTSVADNCWHVTGVRNFGGVITAGANTTIRKSSAISGSLCVADNNAAITPAGSNTLNFNSLSAEYRSNGITIAPVPVATTIGAAFILNLI